MAGSKNLTACGTAGQSFQRDAQQRGGQDVKTRLEKPHKGVIELRMVYGWGFFRGGGGGDLLHWKRRTEIRVFYFQFNSQPCYSLPASPRTTHLGSNILHPIYFSFSSRRAFSWRQGGAEHLRPPHLPRPPAGATGAPREAGTPDGRLDPVLPGPHHRQRATRSFLPLRTSAAPRKRGPGTSRRGAPRGARCIPAAAAVPRPGSAVLPAPAGEEPRTSR